MPNKNYIKGRAKEYKIRTQLLKDGWDIAQRTAGSHSPIDIIAIDKSIKVIKLIQAKPNSMSEKEKRKIEEKERDLNGMFRVEFEVI